RRASDLIWFPRFVSVRSTAGVQRADSLLICLMHGVIRASFLRAFDSGQMTSAPSRPGIRRVNHLFRLLRREPGRVIRLASFSSLFDTVGLAMPQLAPWFFALLAGAIFG